MGKCISKATLMWNTDTCMNPADQYSPNYPNPLLLQEKFAHGMIRNRSILKLGVEAHQLLLNLYDDGFGHFRDTFGCFRRRNSYDILWIIRNPGVLFYYRYIGKDPFEKIKEDREHQAAEEQKEKVQNIQQEYPYFSTE